MYLLFQQLIKATKIINYNFFLLDTFRQLFLLLYVRLNFNILDFLLKYNIILRILFLILYVCVNVCMVNDNLSSYFEITMDCFEK